MERKTLLIAHLFQHLLWNQSTRRSLEVPGGGLPGYSFWRRPDQGSGSSRIYPHQHHACSGESM